MPYDQTTLFLAAGISGAALAMTLFMSWISARADRFLLTWAIGMVLLVVGVTTYTFYSNAPLTSGALVPFALLVSGFCVVYGAAYQFRQSKSPLPHIVVSNLICLPLVALPFAFGVDGLGTMFLNFCSSALLLLTAHQYWGARKEAPASIAAMVLLYGVTSLSFLLCGAMILHGNPLELKGPPDNWAEDFNAIMCLVGITGIGALSLALNQTRAAKRHRLDARTDALTGLVNRRQLFDSYGGGLLEPNTAVIVFDLDRFKTINDDYGHATGDDVLRRFAGAITENLRPRDTAARLGGEEFAIVMPRSTPDLAVLVAERIRALFESDAIPTDKGTLRCTVSAGVAFAAENNESFDEVLRNADNALYLAKRGGRNRVMSPGLRLVA